MSSQLPGAKAEKTVGEADAARRATIRAGLVGLANNTKWDELINAVRARPGWKPRFRFQCIDTIDGKPSQWNNEWCYHLPFPFVSVLWFDLSIFEEIRENRLPSKVSHLDHSQWIEELLIRIGLSYRKGSRSIRVFGYSPHILNHFEEEVP